MSGVTRAPAPILALLIFAAGCTKQGSPFPPDLGPDGGPDATTADLLPHVDCDKTCAGQAAHLCAVAPSSGLCVECLTDSHCVFNPGALGPSCSGTFCTCGTDKDCGSNSNGARCDTTIQVCSCLTDKDCPSSGKCLGSLYGVRVCAPPCAADKDCTSFPAMTCDTSVGRCVECMDSADCPGIRPYCDGASSRCAACSADHHCAAKLFRKICAPGVGCVECTGDADCTAASPGSSCDLKSSQCTCTLDKHCGGNENGAVCQSKARFCSCLVDGDCPAGRKCIGKHQATPICLSPCAADSDCKEPGRPRCQVSTGLCLECLATGDCSDNPDGTVCESGACTCKTGADCAGGYPWGKRCNTAAGRCGCTLVTECAAVPAGPICDTKFYKCSCGKDADCAAAPYTRCALPYAGALFKHCHEPCVTDGDCASRPGLPRCDLATARCAAKI